MRKSKMIMTLVLVIMLLAAGCASEKAVADAETEAVNIEAQFQLSEYPKCDGSSTALPLAEALCAALTGADMGDVNNTIVHHGGNKALTNLFNSAAELIIVDKKDGEIKAKASDSGTEVEIIPVAREYYVFYTIGDFDSEDALTDITKEEADAVVMGQSDKDIKYDNGYFMSGYLPDNINILSVNGVMPTEETVTSGEYPCAFYYNAVIKADTPSDSSIRKIIDVLTSESGQQLVEEAGYVKL